MKNSSTLFWVLAVIGVYVLLIFPRMVIRGEASKTTNKTEEKEGGKPTVEELEKARNGSYTL